MIQCTFTIHVQIDDDMTGGEVRIGAHYDTAPPVCVMLAAEHMAAAAAMQSDAGIDPALALIVAAAKRHCINHLTQMSGRGNA